MVDRFIQQAILQVLTPRYAPGFSRSSYGYRVGKSAHQALSPLLANILLDELDQELERRGHRFCRYADDCTIFVQSQRAGERVLASIAGFLERKLRLRVNWAKSAVSRPWERTFLGYRIRRQPNDPRDVRLHVAPERLKRAKDRIRRITRRSRGVSVLQVLTDLREFTDGWVGYYWRTGYPTLFRELDGWIRRRLRCYQWKLWKTGKNRRRQLRRAGVDPWVARAVTRGLGPWRVALSPPVTLTLPNARLSQLGCSSLHERYLALASA